MEQPCINYIISVQWKSNITGLILCNRESHVWGMRNIFKHGF